MKRAHPVETLLAVLAVLAAAWPIDTLFMGTDWVAGTVALVLLGALSGAAGRALGLPPMAILAGQLLLVTGAAVLTHLSDHLGTSLPSALRDLGTDANHTVTSYAAPAPTTPGILFFIGLIVGIIAISVDFLAVTTRSPAIAGMPLLAEFVISAANSGGSLDPKYFLVLGLAFLAMLYAASERSARDWSGLRARSVGRGSAASLTGGHQFGPLTRVAGVGALLAALVVAGIVPSAHQKFVGKGLARGTSGTATVGFSDDLDLQKNLTNRDQTPVLTFRTADLAPPPLRALTADDYVDGHWSSSAPSYRLRGTDGTATVRDDSNPTPRLATANSMTVSQNTMRPPYIAAPGQVRSANFDGRTWAYDALTGQPSTSRPVSGYQVTYLTPQAGARPTSGDSSRTRFVRDLAVDARAGSRLRALAARVAPKGDDFDRAGQLQEYLREGGGFTYSLTLAATRKDSAGNPLDPISNFLETRRGYCVQFATTMVMLARAIGVPARLAVGFLPGSLRPTGSYQVLQSDAHAWPELYFPGMGWTRFEPTPAARTGEAPTYTLPDAGAGTTPLPRRTVPSARPTASSSSQRTSSRATATAPAARDSGTHVGPLLWVLAGLVAGALILTLVPLLGRRARARSALDADNDAALVEAHWEDLVSRLEDLGVDRSPDTSPRSQEAYYLRQLVVGTAGKDDLHRAVAMLERARYSDRPVEIDQVRTSAEALLEQVRRSQSMGIRVRATLLPRSGLRALARPFTPRSRRRGG